MRKNDITLENTKEALSFVDAHDRDTWVQMGMAVKSEFGDAGFEAWDQWSRTAGNYDIKAAKNTWRSISQHGGTTIASLIFSAKQNGWTSDGIAIAPELPEIQRHRMTQRVNEIKKEKARHKKAAESAMDLFRQCKAGTQHPYMISKGLGDETVLLDAAGNMIIPMMLSPGELSAIQKIDNTGKKLFYPAGCKTGGAYFALGNIMRPEYIWLCEGVATGYTMHKILRDRFRRENDAVVICFSGSNLKKMAARFKQEKADGFTQIKNIFVVADNDAPICPNTNKLVPYSALKENQRHDDDFDCPHCDVFHSWPLTYGLKIAIDTELSYIYCMTYGKDINDVFRFASMNPQYRQDLFLSEFFAMMDHKTNRVLDIGYGMQPVITGKIGELQIGMRRYME